MSLVATYLQDIRTDYPSRLDRDQMRRTQTGALVAVLEMTNSANSIIPPDLQERARVSQGRNLDVPVLQKGAITISNTRSCTISGAQSTSALVRVVWRTVRADLEMVPGQYEKNEIGYTADLAKKIADIVEAFNIDMETQIVTQLESNKSQVYASTIVTTRYAITANAIRVQESVQDFFFNDIHAINQSDDFYGEVVKVIGNPNLSPTVRKFVNQGSGNDENQAFQFAGFDFSYTNRVTNGAGVNATGYFMPDGSIGLITRVDTDARNNRRSTSGTEWSEQVLPGMQFPVGVQFKSDCSDESSLESSGLGFLESTLSEKWQFSFDYAIIVPYNSAIATRASSIRKFEFIPNP